jgi:hypothetical protein
MILTRSRCPVDFRAGNTSYHTAAAVQYRWRHAVAPPRSRAAAVEPDIFVLLGITAPRTSTFPPHLTSHAPLLCALTCSRFDAHKMRVEANELHPHKNNSGMPDCAPKLATRGWIACRNWGAKVNCSDKLKTCPPIAPESIRNAKAPGRSSGLIRGNADDPESCFHTLGNIAQWEGGNGRSTRRAAIDEITQTIVFAVLQCYEGNVFA